MSIEIDYGDWAGTPTVVYRDPLDRDGEYLFLRICIRCGRFVKADSTVRFEWPNLQPRIPNATCARCGRTNMPDIGYYP